MPDTQEIARYAAEWSAAVLELLGLAVVVAAAGYAIVRGLAAWARRSQRDLLCITRHRLARGILLGLEFLVAADIIRTIAIKLSLTSVAVLAGVVAIRTFLSFALEVEMYGHWPWQGEGKEQRCDDPNA